MKSERLQKAINLFMPIFTLMHLEKDTFFVVFADLKEKGGFKVFAVIYSTSLDELLKSDTVFQWIKNIEENGWHDYDYIIFNEGKQMDEGEMYDPFEKAFRYTDDGEMQMRKTRKSKKPNDLIIGS